MPLFIGQTPMMSDCEEIVDLCKALVRSGNDSKQDLDFLRLYSTTEQHAGTGSKSFLL
jgi:hypothetical protein